MKIIPFTILALILLAISTWCYADAPSETYFLDRKQISDDILRKTKGVLTLNIVDSKAYAEYYGQSKIMDTPFISIFNKNGKLFKKVGILNKADIKTPTGGEYGPFSWYRFPVINKQGTFCEIIYNLPKHKKCWVKITELESTLIDNKPVLNWFTNQYSSEEVTVDIFYLIPNNEIKLYNSPSLESSSRIVTPKSKILTANGAFDVQAFKIVEQKNGFGHLSIAYPDRSKGWIRLRDENELLLVWPITGYGD